MKYYIIVLIRRYTTDNYNLFAMECKFLRKYCFQVLKMLIKICTFAT